MGMAPIGVISVVFSGRSRGAPKGDMHAFYGQKHTDETKAVMRKKRAGKKPAAGVVHSEENKKSWSEQKKGTKRKPRDPEWSKKISDAKKGKATQTGRVRTPEQRLNMSNAAKARWARIKQEKT